MRPPRVHYVSVPGDWTPCGYEAVEHSTANPERVTCKMCLRAINPGSNKSLPSGDSSNLRGERGAGSTRVATAPTDAPYGKCGPLGHMDGNEVMTQPGNRAESTETKGDGT